MASAPLVSVVIATYNWSSVLRFAIASVLRQTLGDFELWVIGDACTDDSEQVVASFGDARVYWHNRDRNSASQAAPNNDGVARSRGRYIAYLGQDDLWHPEHLASTVATARATGADVVYALAEVISPGGDREISGLTTGGELTAADYVVPSSLLHRRELFEEVGPWPLAEEEAWPVDIAWQQRLWAAGKSFRGTGRLTVIKFPSAQRSRSYVEKPSHEQREYTGRLLAEPDFVERELVAVARAALTHPPRGFRVADIPVGAKGWLHSLNRQRRGLDGGETMTPLTPEQSTGLRLRLLSAPARVPAGKRFVVSVELENQTAVVLRSTLPNPVQLSYHWFDENGERVVFGGLRTPLFQTLGPGRSESYSVTVNAPSAAGRYRLRAESVQELVRWHEHPGAECDAWIDVEHGEAPGAGGVSETVTKTVQ